MNVVIILKALCVIGFIMDAVLLFLSIRKNLQTEEGRAAWKKQKDHVVWNSIVGFVANFFDTLGIGSFAPSSSAFKLKKSVDDINIPGTLNAGDTFPVLAEAFLFFTIVEVDTLTLVLMLAAATLGAFIGAGIVTKWDVHKVRLGMGIGLGILGVVMACRSLGVGPFGITGTALALRGWKLVIAVVFNFISGAMMNIGVGQYAPCLALISVLGMNVQAAFPIMMGSSAFLMGFGNTPKFIKENRYDMVATVAQGVFGCIGVFIAYVFVKSLPLTVLMWIVIAVVFLTSFLFFKDAIKDRGIA